MENFVKLVAEREVSKIEVCVCGGGVVACFEDGGDHKLRNTDSVLELRATPADTKQEHETLV